MNMIENVGNSVAIGVHVDSVALSANAPDGVFDPTYFSVLDRFLEIAERRQVPLTFFVVGKELRQDEHAARIAAAAAAGHEIGSHTWSHPIDLSYLPEDEIEKEIETELDELIQA